MIRERRIKREGWESDPAFRRQLVAARIAEYEQDPEYWYAVLEAANPEDRAEAAEWLKDHGHKVPEKRQRKYAL